MADLVADAYLAIRLGEMQFRSPDICALAIALTAAMLSALNLGRIAQSEGRQRRLLEALRRGPYHFTEPSQPPRLPWYQWLGATVVATRVIGTAAQERLLAALVAAGIKGHGHLAALLTAKLFGAMIVCPTLLAGAPMARFFRRSCPVRFVFLVAPQF